MVVGAVQSYLNMVNGLSKMTRDRAIQTARALLAQVGLEDAANDAEKRVTRLAEEILAARRANRELVEKLVASEVDKAAARWGFVRSEDVDALREEIAELRRSLIKATVDNATSPERAATKTAKKAPADRVTGAKKRASQGPPLGGAADVPGVDPNLPDPPLGEKLVTDPGEPGSTPLIQTPAEVAAEPHPTPPEASTPVRRPAEKAANQPGTVKKSAVKKSAVKNSVAKKSAVKKSVAKKAPGTVGSAAASTTAAKKQASATRAVSRKTATSAELPAPATAAELPAPAEPAALPASDEPAALPASVAPLTTSRPDPDTEQQQ